MKKLAISILFIFCLYNISLNINFNTVSAQEPAVPDVEFGILPEKDKTDQELANIITGISQTGGNVVNEYNKQASGLSLPDQLATGIMNWDTIIYYLVYLIKFLSQLGMFIGGIMIIYAGYLYATSIFGGKGETTAKQAIKNAIIGVVVITFAYAIMKIFTAMFLGT
ncbi:hypothetical protein AGMMS50249_2630 [candidate division SR1 bacterium]|nr:hypothetical protein AGMMS50249_2630 [candidate division SR1 bacterium]